MTHIRTLTGDSIPYFMVKGVPTVYCPVDCISIITSYSEDRLIEIDRYI